VRPLARQVEELGVQLEASTSSQRDLYSDLDKRIADLGRGLVGGGWRALGGAGYGCGWLVAAESGKAGLECGTPRAGVTRRASSEEQTVYAQSSMRSKPGVLGCHHGLQSFLSRYQRVRRGKRAIMAGEAFLVKRDFDSATGASAMSQSGRTSVKRRTRF